jgi:hypothetical protein
VLPLPIPKLSPQLRFADGRTGGLTGAPVWLWTDPEHWAPRAPLTGRAQAGPVWAAVAAAPVRTTWVLGDGTTERCTTPGTPLTDPATALRGSPDCGHTYHRTSATQPDGRYRVTVSTTWAVTWTGSDGTAGTLVPLTVHSTFDYTVRQARAQLVARE